jgi:SAM-dependent methyltransferase
MARIDYDHSTAAAFRQAREIPRAGLQGWRRAIAGHLQPQPGMRVLDVGAGTGAFSCALRDWFDVSVIAVEPSDAMRALIPSTPGIQVLAGAAEALPVPDAHADAAWLSTVIHHIPDLPVAARELRRVLRPGAPVLIRAVFPGRLDGLSVVRFFPETRRILDTFPSVGTTCEAFEAAGFRQVALESVPQQTSTSPADAATRINRRADTALRALTDEEFAAGMARLSQAAASPPQPVIDHLDLLVLR